MRVLTIIGTRPEAVKMAPVLRCLAARPDIASILASTGQHPDLIDEPLAFFELAADHNLGLMLPGEHPEAFAARATAALAPLIDSVRPDHILVQGDTGSAVAGARAAAAANISLGHIEAGLRTYGRLPWPEEMFRCEIDRIADILFAPTPLAADNLRREGVGGQIHVTGNSGIDACRLVIERLEADSELRAECDALLPVRTTTRPLLLATLHRRESFAAAGQLCEALLALADAGLAEMVMPVHPNGALTDHLAALADRPAIHLTAPLPFVAMIRLMQQADLILTDSGGIQEEAPGLGKPVLVLRDQTERPEAVAAGMAKLVGLDRDRIVAEARVILEGGARFAPANLYGDGHAAERIVAALLGEAFSPFVAPPLDVAPRMTIPA